MRFSKSKENEVAANEWHHIHPAPRAVSFLRWRTWPSSDNGQNLLVRALGRVEGASKVKPVTAGSSITQSLRDREHFVIKQVRLTPLCLLRSLSWISHGQDPSPGFPLWLYSGPVYTCWVLCWHSLPTKIAFLCFQISCSPPQTLVC